MFQQEGYDLMAAAFEVYNEIGYGMAEEIYQQSLEIELSLRQVPFLTKQELEVYYKGHKLTKWKRFILSDLHEKPVPAMPAGGRPEGRNTNQERNTNQL